MNRSQLRIKHVVVAACVAGLLLTTAAVSASAQAGGGLVRGGDTPDLLLLHTGDVVGYIEPCG